MKIRLILFDLGGVLYNIEHARTHSALNDLQIPNAKPISFSLEHAETIFGEFDSGTLNASDFFSSLRERHNIQGSDEQIINAWNAMLLGLYPDTIEFIQEISRNVPIALLSNINEIHHDFVREECAPLFNYFEHLFLSYTLNLKKPDPAIFQYVIAKTGYAPNDILFLDDTPINCSIAQTLGIHTRLIDPRSREWLHEIKHQIL
jgi:putative hydrolase of the HAD superfamily